MHSFLVVVVFVNGSEVQMIQEYYPLCQSTSKTHLIAIFVVHLLKTNEQ